MAEENNSVHLKKVNGISPEVLHLQKELGKGKSVVGIDIGASSIKVVQSVVHRGAWMVIKAALEDIVLINEGGRDKAVRDALRKVLAGFDMRNAKIVCVLSIGQVFVENILMPVMPPEEVAEAVRLEVSGAQHYTIEKPAIDFKSIGTTVEKGVEKMVLIVAVAPMADINKLLDYFMSAGSPDLSSGFRKTRKDRSIGLELSAIIPIAIALENVIKLSSLRMDETVAMIEAGTIATELNIYHNAILEFTRQIPVTSFDLTRCLTRPLFTTAGKIELTFEEAERIKRDYGIPAQTDSYFIDDKIAAGQILALLRSSLEQFAIEINRSIGYYYEKRRATKVDRIIVLGGGANLKGLPEFLKGELDIPVAVGSSLQGVDLLYKGILGKDEDLPKMAAAVGASMRNPDSINLLPVRLRNRKELRMWVFAGITAGVIFIGFIGAYIVGFQNDLKKARAASMSARAEYQSLVPKLEAFKNSLQLKRIGRSRKNLDDLFKQLTSLVPEMYLTRLEVDDSKVVLTGFVTLDENAARKELMYLRINLKKMHFKDVELSSMEPVQDKPGSMAFQMQALFDPEGGGR